MEEGRKDRRNKGKEKKGWNEGGGVDREVGSEREKHGAWG